MSFRVFFQKKRKVTILARNVYEYFVDSSLFELKLYDDYLII